MARLHEYQGKPLLSRAGLAVPRGGPASTPEGAAEIARTLGCSVVLKIQAWTTRRAALGGVAFADTPEQAAEHASRLLRINVGNFPVREVLVEEKLDIARELFVSLSIDDRERAPVMLVSLAGGSGVEERAAGGEVKRLLCDVDSGVNALELIEFLKGSGLPEPQRQEVAAAVHAVFRAARDNEARSVEVNPLAILKDGSVVAADCRVTIDDYAVLSGRHPDLGIDIARELDHPPTPLERIAYAVEQSDHRGTFYFAQMNTEPRPGSKGLIGFHGAGGGGSMMSMDAITHEGFTIANFCDTSGNPSPAKVYRAARIILSQPGLIGYFGSGSGVANQEQYWSAYGLAKAFWELNLDIPAVIRLGGNTEDRAVEILESSCRAANLPATVEAYKKSDTPAKIAARFSELVLQSRSRNNAAAPPAATSSAPRRPGFVGSPAAFWFSLKSARLWIDPGLWKAHASAIIARCSGMLRDENGKPAPTLPPEQFAAKDSELIAAEVECRRDGIDGLYVEVDIPGL